MPFLSSNRQMFLQKKISSTLSYKIIDKPLFLNSSKSKHQKSQPNCCYSTQIKIIVALLLDCSLPWTSLGRFYLTLKFPHFKLLSFLLKWRRMQQQCLYADCGVKPSQATLKVPSNLPTQRLFTTKQICALHFQGLLLFNFHHPKERSRYYMHCLHQILKLHGIQAASKKKSTIKLSIAQHRSKHFFMEKNVKFCLIISIPK